MIRRVARRWRTTPQYAAARRRAVLALRANELVQRAAAAVSGPARRGRSRRVGLPVPAGAAVPDDDHRTLPLVVVTLLGMTTQEVAEAAAAVQREQVLSGSFRPVFVLDAPALAELRARGWIGELLVPEEAWERIGGLGTWQDYAGRHVQRVVETYGADLVVPLAPGEPGASQLGARLAVLPLAAS